MKILGHCAAWVFAFLAVLVSPVVLIYGVPLAIGVGAEIVEAGGGPIAAVLIASATVCLLLSKTPMVAAVRAVAFSAASRGVGKRRDPGPAPRPLAKSLG